MRLEQPSQKLLDLHVIWLDGLVPGQGARLSTAAADRVGNAIADALMRSVLGEEDPVLTQSALQTAEAQEDQMVETLAPC